MRRHTLRNSKYRWVQNLEPFGPSTFICFDRPLRSLLTAHFQSFEPPTLIPEDRPVFAFQTAQILIWDSPVWCMTVQFQLFWSFSLTIRPVWFKTVHIRLDPESELQITGLLLDEIFETCDFFHPSIFDYVIIWKSCGWKISQKFQNFSPTAVDCGLTVVSNLFFHRLFSRYERW